jgi:hypothetical protein
MKARIIYIDGMPPIRKEKITKKSLKNSKITGLVKRIKHLYNDQEIQEWFNYPGFERG